MQLHYETEELMRCHDYAEPQIEAGHRLHGGFDADGHYVSPRTLVRGPAIEAWTGQLQARGGQLLKADSSLLQGVRYPSYAQHRYLLQSGLGQSFWNTLTITGVIEARGQILAEMVFPEFQDAVDEDVSGMAIGHLNKGLLRAHGLDEGGEPDKGIGGHDQMWFAARDLAFGDTEYPHPEVPENIARPESQALVQLDLLPGYAQAVYMLLNLLMIEFRAELVFTTSERLMLEPQLFSQRRSEAEHGAVLIDRIRQDEGIHVESLRLYMGELRSLHFKTQSGGLVPGSEVVDSLWREIVVWATQEQPKLQAEQQRELFRTRILAHTDGERVLAEFDALA
jgi:hypothetical protein